MADDAPPLLVLHLSDLHFGEHGRFTQQPPAELAGRLRSALVDEGERLGADHAANLVIVTGDVTEKALPSEFATAGSFFKCLASELQIPHSQFVFCPGNHDVSWIECKKAELHVEEHSLGDAALREFMDARKLAPFWSFVEEFRGENSDAQTLAGGATIYNLRDLSLSVAALNSCEAESHRPTDHYGDLSELQAQAVLDHWTAQRTAVTRIVAIHHNPTPSPPFAVAEWAKQLEKARESGGLSQDALSRFLTDAVGFQGRERLHVLAEDAKVQLVLHGHHHATTRHDFPWRRGATGATHVLAAGSWGADAGRLPTDQPNAVQVMLLDRKKGMLHARVLVYEPRRRPDAKVAAGMFVPDPASPEGFVQPLHQGRDKEVPAGRKVQEQQQTAPGSRRPDDTPPPLDQLPDVRPPDSQRGSEAQRRLLPDEAHSISHNFSIAGHRGTVVVTMYEDGKPGQVFLTLNKEGTAINGLMGTVGTVMTLALQYGVPLQVIVDELAHVRFEPSGFTKNPQLPYAKSLADYLARWLATKFLADEVQEKLGIRP